MSTHEGDWGIHKWTIQTYLSYLLSLVYAKLPQREGIHGSALETMLWTPARRSEFQVFHNSLFAVLDRTGEHSSSTTAAF